MERNDSIIKKIRGLLAIANDEKNDEESQTAFILAQKLMMKHNIVMRDIESVGDKDSIHKGQVTVHKKLFWWEKNLAAIVSSNFRVKYYYNNKVLEGERNVKRSIVFLGYESDVELAKEMYILAYDVLVFYTKRFVDNYYEENFLPRVNRITSSLKNSYKTGFLNGLNDKFKKQVEEMKQEYGLMVLVPKEVEEEYDKMFKGTKGLTYTIPKIEEVAAYHQGYSEGNQVDYTQSTIDDEILV